MISLKKQSLFWTGTGKQVSCIIKQSRVSVKYAKQESRYCWTITEICHIFVQAKTKASSKAQG